MKQITSSQRASNLISKDVFCVIVVDEYFSNADSGARLDREKRHPFFKGVHSLVMIKKSCTTGKLMFRLADVFCLGFIIAVS